MRQPLPPNRNRIRIRGIVQLSPGIHLRELQRVSGISFTSARHHTAKLIRAGEVESFSYKGRVRLFPRGFPDSDKVLVSEVKGNSAAAVLKGIAEDGLGSNGEISKATGLAKSTVSKYVSNFLKLGIIHRRFSPQGRVEYASEPSKADLLKLSTTVLRSAVDNYVELWDF